MKFRLLLPAILVMLFASCSEYSRVAKGKDLEAKLALAIKLYDKGEYYKALPLLEELITVYRGTKKAEQTYYYYAYTNYKIGDYETAAYDFENFAKTYPSSELAEECSFMHAYCFYMSSPEYSLDQTNTLKAINELQLFTDRYPASKRIEECNKLIDQLRFKLETKSFENANLYFNTSDYKAAITAYKILLHDFPASRYKEDALFRILRAAYMLAENSIEVKKAERYSETIRAYAEFINAYPESRDRDKAEDLMAQAQKKLDKLTTN
jgi:outer membrane protein assembly factor BamD